jgi:uncharacterized protein YkwD
MPYLRPRIVAAASRHSRGTVAAAPEGGLPRFAFASAILMAAWALCSVVAASSAATLDSQPTTLRSLQRSVIVEINAVRREQGRRPLRLSVSLAAAALQHSQEMAERGYFSHSSANGESFSLRIARFYPLRKQTLWMAGENLYWTTGTTTADTTIEAWLQSPVHRENLLNRRWREVGIGAVSVDSALGVYGDAPVTIVTADFGLRR